MSELLSTQPNNRLQLLSTVSALSLMLAVSTNAKAEDANRPTVWIELGGQLSRLENKQELYSPPFLALEPAQFDSPLPSMRPTGYGMEANGAITIQPQNSDWIFSASARYGRSSNSHRFNQQSYPGTVRANAANGYKYYVPLAAQAISATSTNRESHAVLDFQAGRDIGVGLFGRESSSSLSLGVRFAQFQSKSTATLNEDPDWHPFIRTLAHVGTRAVQVANQVYHTYEGQFEAGRSFHGVGPSLSWKSTVPIAGDEQDRVLTVDWGVNGAVLFGRQKTRTQHQTSAQYHSAGPAPLGNRGPGRHPVYHHPTDAPAYYSTRDRNVTVPNVGGFAALSFRYDVAKISFGYRADFFFGAIDGGIDSRKTYDRNFYGPFANISFGLGG
jgi:hypothetical protein